MTTQHELQTHILSSPVEVFFYWDPSTSKQQAGSSVYSDAFPFKKSEWDNGIRIKYKPQIRVLEKWLPPGDGVSGGCRNFRRGALLEEVGFWELEGYSAHLSLRAGLQRCEQAALCSCCHSREPSLAISKHSRTQYNDTEKGTKLSLCFPKWKHCSSSAGAARISLVCVKHREQSK